MTEQLLLHLAGLVAIVAVVWVIWRDTKPRAYPPDRIDRVELGPNDTLVIQYDQILSKQQRDGIRENLVGLGIAPSNKTVVLDGGARLGVIKNARADRPAEEPRGND